MNKRALSQADEGFDREDIKYLRKYGDEIPKSMVAKSPYHCRKCGIPLILKWGIYGPFLACPRFPDCRFTMVLPKPSPSNPYFQSYKEVECQKCDGTGLLPFYNKAGKEILHTFIYCACHKESEPTCPKLPEDFDFPCSYVWRAYYAEQYGS